MRSAEYTCVATPGTCEISVMTLLTMSLTSAMLAPYRTGSAQGGLCSGATCLHFVILFCRSGSRNELFDAMQPTVAAAIHIIHKVEDRTDDVGPIQCRRRCIRAARITGRGSLRIRQHGLNERAGRNCCTVGNFPCHSECLVW